MKNNKGITLIALVITIVVLIILAGVSIDLVLGENGIITKAGEARNKITETTLNEQIAINEIIEYMNGIGENKSDESQVTYIPDGNGETMPVPNGFYYVGGDINTGIVISDNIKDKDKGTEYEIELEGNQFVWIPVKSEEDLTRTFFSWSDGKPGSGMSSNYWIEPSTKGYITEVEEFNKMKQQVLKYKGFYIGRFEAGDGSNGTNLRTGATPAHQVVIKKGVAPYNYIPWGKAMNDQSEIEGQSGAVYLSKKMYESSNSVVSTLCYGSQWDAMCRYIGDSQRTTPIKSGPELTGSVKTDVSKNIYDLAGNCIEWTMEERVDNKYDNRAGRGCFYEASNPVHFRGSSFPNSTFDNATFRPTLYIK